MTATCMQTEKTFVDTEVELHLLINQLTLSTMASAIRRRNYLLNEVPPDLSVNTDSQKLASILSTLLYSVMGQAQDTCIRISAKEFSNITLVHIKDNKRHTGNGLSSHLVKAQEMAESIGGTVFVNTYRDGSTTIALSILNNVSRKERKEALSTQ